MVNKAIDCRIFSRQKAVFFYNRMLWDDLRRLRGSHKRRPLERTPDTKFPGGHRSRVTPVPIPNTEVKPATADGTARAGGWESIPDTKFPGGHRSRVTPVPIPNTEVKPATADGSARAGGWESRSLPGINSKPE